jgi:hypothetical protein
MMSRFLPRRRFLPTNAWALGAAGTIGISALPGREGEGDLALTGLLDLRDVAIEAPMKEFFL